MNALQGTPEWRAARKGRITASRVGAILGVSKFQSRADVMREMVREHFDAPRESDDNNPAFAHGNKYEPVALRQYEEETGAFVENLGFIEWDEDPRFGVSPDGLAHGDGWTRPVEVKCPFRGSIESVLENKGYWHQLQMQMKVMGYYSIDFYVWRKDGAKLVMVQRDPEWWDRYSPELIAFHDEFTAIINNPELAAQYLDSPDADMSNNDEWQKHAASFIRVNGMIKQLTEELNLHKAELLRLAKEQGRSAKGAGVEVLHFTQKGSVDTKRMSKEGIDVDAYRSPDVEVWKCQASKS